jgi:hypothetical protein
MTTEATEPQVTEAQTQETEAQQEAAFAAGFAEARGDEPPAEAPAAESKTEAEETQTEAAQTEEPAKPQPVLAGLTEEEIKSLLAKAGEVDGIKAETDQRVRQVFGKLGEINALVQQLQQSRSQSTGVKLAPEGLKRLHAEFPEMAQMLVEDLNEALAGTSQAAATVDPTAVDTLVTERLTTLEEKLSAEMEKRWLKRQHKDWEQVVASTDFKLWKDNVLPKAEAEQLATSWDADYIAEKLTDFKDWKAKAAAATQNKQKRLEAAITPQGAGSTGQNSLNEDEAFLAGFKAVRG